MPTFSEDQVMALAPDPGSAKSGRDLAHPRKWVSHGSNTDAVWGECQGSGARPYQTCIDFRAELAFKCSCPSRKFPCKHGLGLLFMFAAGAVSASISSPQWVEQWLQTRLEKAEKKQLKQEAEKESEKQAVDPGRKAKSQANRAARVETGLQEFRLWLKDRIRQGLAGTESQSYQFWENSAARLTDAQAPGLARVLRQCAGITASGPGWQERLLERLSMLHLAVEAFASINELPEPLQADLRTLIGFTISQEELLQNEAGIFDEWQILAKRVELEDRLKIQRTWLRGKNTNRWALVLHFAHGMTPLDISLSPGFSFEGELVFFPGAYPLRALVKKKGSGMKQVDGFKVYPRLSSFCTDFAEAISENPFLEQFPLALENIRIYLDKNNRSFLVDDDGLLLPLKTNPKLAYHMLALSGGKPMGISGEWNGESVLPLSCFVGSKYYSLEARLLADVT